MVVGAFVNMTEQNIHDPLWVCDVKVVVANFTKCSIFISCSKQFSAVQHVEVITNLLQIAQGLFSD